MESIEILNKQISKAIHYENEKTNNDLKRIDNQINQYKTKLYTVKEKKALIDIDRKELKNMLKSNEFSVIRINQKQSIKR